MGLLDDLSQDLVTRHAHKCTVRHVLEQVEGLERDRLQEFIDNHDVNATALTRILIKNGLEIKASAITRHRRKECACDVK